MSRSLLVIAIYRAPMTTDGSTLPFVYTSPKPDTQLRFKDRIFVWCSPDQLRENLPMLKENLKEFADGSVSMADTLGVQVGDTTVDNRHKEQQEEAKSSNDQNLHTSGSDDAQYKYLLPSVEGTNASPLKQSVSRVYFEGTDIPL